MTGFLYFQSNHFMPKNKSITLKVKVTAEDIRLGCPEDVENCPVARAVLRTVARELNKSRVGRLLAESLSVDVDSGMVDVMTDNFSFDTFLIQHKRHVSDFIDNFDKLPNLQEELADAGKDMSFYSKHCNENGVEAAKETIEELLAQIKACKAKIKPFSFFLTLS